LQKKLESGKTGEKNQNLVEKRRRDVIPFPKRKRMGGGCNR